MNKIILGIILLASMGLGTGEYIVKCSICGSVCSDVGVYPKQTPTIINSNEYEGQLGFGLVTCEMNYYKHQLICPKCGVIKEYWLSW